MIGLAGPYDFLPFKDADVGQVFSSAKKPLETQPVFYVDDTDPHLLLLTGDADKSVNPRNSYRLEEAMRRRGGNAQTIAYEGVGHVKILVALAPWAKFLAPALQDTTEFIRNTQCGP